MIRAGERDEYTAVCNRCGTQTFFTTEGPCTNAFPARCRCCGQIDENKPYVKCGGTRKLIDRSGLAPQFHEFYRRGSGINAGRRIIVRMGYSTPPWSGRKSWDDDPIEVSGTVGRTGGWKPSYMLLRRSDSMGSSDLVGADDKIVAVQKLATDRNGETVLGKGYIPVAWDADGQPLWTGARKAVTA